MLKQSSTAFTRSMQRLQFAAVEWLRRVGILPEEREGQVEDEDCLRFFHIDVIADKKGLPCSDKAIGRTTMRC